MFRHTSGDTTIHLRPIRLADLELIMAWRSDPDIYEQLLQQEEPLHWEEHLNWFAERPDRREDFMITYNGRRVGVISINQDNMISIYVGEKSVWGNGIGTMAVEWLCNYYAGDRTPRTIVGANNVRSQSIFENLNFTQVDERGDKYEYVFEGQN
jgi:RimJ/RimL family protein N-acetyltransferase